MITTHISKNILIWVSWERQTKKRKYCISQRNKFSVGEQIEVMKPNGDNIEVTVKSIQDEEGNQMESAPHPKQILYIDLGIKLDRYDILRRKEPVTEL